MRAGIGPAVVGGKLLKLIWHHVGVIPSEDSSSRFEPCRAVSERTRGLLMNPAKDCKHKSEKLSSAGYLAVAARMSCKTASVISFTLPLLLLTISI